MRSFQYGIFFTSIFAAIVFLSDGLAFAMEAVDPAELPPGRVVVGAHESGVRVAALVPGVFGGMVGVSYKYGDDDEMDDLVVEYRENGYFVFDVRPQLVRTPKRPSGFTAGLAPGILVGATEFHDFPQTGSSRGFNKFLLFLIRNSRVVEEAEWVSLCYSNSCRYYYDVEHDKVRSAILASREMLLEKYLIEWSEAD